MKRAIIVLLIIAAIGAGAGAYYMRRGGPEISVNTAPVTRGDIVDTVGSTGTLQAVTTRAGRQPGVGQHLVAGRRLQLDRQKGQVIAKLDPSLFQAQVEQARRIANQARNQQGRQLEHRTRCSCSTAQQKFTRAKELRQRSLDDAGAISTPPRSPSISAGQPAVAAGQGADRGGRRPGAGHVNQNQVNLDHTIITAPIDGIVTQRSVDVGQTVRGEHVGADAVHHRRRPDEDAGQRQHRRVRRRPHPAGPERDVPRRRVSGRRVRGHGRADSPAAVVVQNVTTYGDDHQRPERRAASSSPA